MSSAESVGFADTHNLKSIQIPRFYKKKLKKYIENYMMEDTGVGIKEEYAESKYDFLFYFGWYASYSLLLFLIFNF